MNDDAPKSAVELAMERLRKQDADAGISDHVLTTAQKAEIADLRQTFGAKLAQEEILYKTKMQASVDFDERQKLEENYRRDVERISHDRDRKIDKIHQMPGA